MIKKIMRKNFLRLKSSTVFNNIILGFLCPLVVLGVCPEAAPEIGSCLHTYLERDFIDIEPFLEMSTSRRDRTRILINGPDLENGCEKIKEMVDCYAELDGECYDLRIRRRYSYLVHTLFKLHYWLCDENKRIQTLLTNLACIRQVQNDPSCQSSYLLPDNVWQQMFRLEAGPETCRSFQKQLACFKTSKRIFTYCGNQSHEMYVNGMELWLDGWCIDEGGHSRASTTNDSHIFSSFLVVAFWILLKLWRIVS